MRITVYASSKCSTIWGAMFLNGQICADENVKDSRLWSLCKITFKSNEYLSGGSLFVNQVVNGKNKFVLSGIVSYGGKIFVN
jgi:hypothetical protein